MIKISFQQSDVVLLSMNYTTYIRLLNIMRFTFESFENDLQI